MFKVYVKYIQQDYNIMNKNNIIFILQIIILINAQLMGWSIKTIDNKRIVLTKNIKYITHLDDNLHKIIKQLIPL